MGHPKPPCDLLMLLPKAFGITPVHKGLTPSGLSSVILRFVKELLVNLPFKAHTQNIGHLADSAKNEDNSNK